MEKVRKIELLAPAKDITCGMEAILHGADAVYIGASKFGARAAAGNSIEDISKLVSFAHFYGARVYVTVNTILKDCELEPTVKMIHQLYDVGVDALIIQDMALLKLDLPPIELHASTQMDNRTPEQVKFLQECGLEQVVLARELSLNEIYRIHKTCSVRLEAFVHGALCVSFSGRCYASQNCFGRSANRGECAQFCRLSFDMEDSEGHKVIRKKHLLSLRDMNRSGSLEEMMDAGISSFKIEGRLKSVAYVKNITAYYRQKIDEILARRSDYEKSSSGKVHLLFQPDPEKSFNRGFTDYFLHGRDPEITSFDTPKSRGELMGEVIKVDGRSLTVAGKKGFHNGDGICYVDKDGLHGLRINRAEGNRLYPAVMARVPLHTAVYRNVDNDFEKLLSKATAERKISADVLFKETSEGFLLQVHDEDGFQVSALLKITPELAHTPQNENIRRQLIKWGGTLFEPSHVCLQLSKNWFIPSSELAKLRREVLEKLGQLRRQGYKRSVRTIQPSKKYSFYTNTLGFEFNVMNNAAASFYKEHGVEHIRPAFEKQRPEGEVPVMFCKHCLRYSMGWCPSRQHGKSPYKEPYYLRMDDGRRFRLEFDCKNCQMIVLAPPIK